MIGEGYPGRTSSSAPVIPGARFWGEDQLRKIRPPLVAAFAQRRAPAIGVKTGRGSRGVTVGLPAAAAGIVPAAVFNEAHHILQRVPQKYADFMGKRPFPAETAAQLFQQRTAAVGRRIAPLLQKRPDGRLRQNLPEPGRPIDIQHSGARAGTDV